MSDFSNTPSPMDEPRSDEPPVRDISQMEPSEIINLKKAYVEELQMNLKLITDEIANTQKEIEELKLESKKIETAPAEEKPTLLSRFFAKIKKNAPIALSPCRTDSDGRLKGYQIPVVDYLWRNLLYYPFTGVKNKKPPHVKGGTKRRYRLKNKGTRRR